jgi:hypothetical protein
VRERPRLLGLPFLTPCHPFDRFVEVRIEVAPQFRQVRAARAEDALAVGIVREGVQEVFEGHVGVPPRDGLAVRDRQDDFKRRGEHRLFSEYRILAAAAGLALWRGVAMYRQTFRRKNL